MVDLAPATSQTPPMTLAFLHGRWVASIGFSVLRCFCKVGCRPWDMFFLLLGKSLDVKSWFLLENVFFCVCNFSPPSG